MSRRPQTRYALFFFILVWLCAAPLPAAATFAEDELTARSALLINSVTGEVLYQREPDLRLPPASTTKIVTAIVALEQTRLDQFLRVSSSAARAPRSRIGLRPGQKVSVQDLLYSVLLSSANDASIVLAEGIAGSVARFAAMMNQKVRQLGARQSHFVNPHGLTAVGHESTAREMAVIFNYAMGNPTFRRIVQTKTISVSSLASKNRRVRRIPVRNHNRLLWGFEGAIGGKTGYTNAAQRCFVGGASRNGTTLTVAILGSRDLWGDTTALLEYGFDMQEATAAAHASLVNAKKSPDAQPQDDSFGIPAWDENLKARSWAGYILQVGSFRDRSRADALFQDILDAGHRAFLEATVLPTGETAYRVRVGPFADLETAQQAAAEIETRSSHRTLILPPS